MGIARISLDRLFERIPSRVHPPHVEERNPLIYPGNFELRIELGRRLKVLESFFKQLLIHVGRAQIIEASRLRRLAHLRIGWKGSPEDCRHPTKREEREDLSIHAK